nr:alanine--tRNA ligase-related protein [uncultured Peptostreptococcus sp.]
MKRTEALYYEEVYMNTCKSKLVSVKINDERIYLVFDRTIFFPGGGGQAQDRGYLIDKNGIRFNILSLYEDQGIVYHEVLLKKYNDGSHKDLDSNIGINLGDLESMTMDYLQSKINEGDIFEIFIDWNHRQDYMCQHTGQHLLSGVFYKLFSRNTLGLHIGKDLSQLDIEGEFDDEMVRQVERYANDLISQKIDIDNYVLEKDRFDTTHTRRPLPKSDKEIRILKIGDIDTNACCGVHCRDTSQLRIIKIRKYYKHKSNTRFEYLVANRAVSYLLNRDDYFSKLLFKYDTNETNILNAVENIERKKDSYSDKNKFLLEYYLLTRTSQLLDKSKEYNGGILVVKEILDDEDWLLESLARYIASNHRAIVILASRLGKFPKVFLQVDKKLAKENNFKLGKYFKEYANLADIRGGGTDYMAQGQVFDKKNIDKFLDKIYSICTGLTYK